MIFQGGSCELIIEEEVNHILFATAAQITHAIRDDSLALDPIEGGNLIMEKKPSDKQESQNSFFEPKHIMSMQHHSSTMDGLVSQSGLKMCLML